MKPPVLTSPGAWYTAVSVVLVFGVATPAYLVYGADSAAPWTAIIPCSAIAFWASLRLAIIVTSEVHAIFQVCFWSFVLVFMGLAPIASMATGTWGVAPPPHRDDLLPAALIVIVGLISVQVGERTLRVPPIREVAQPVAVKLSGTRTWLLTFASWTIMAIAFWTLDFSTFFATRTDLDELLVARFGEIGRLIAGALVRYPIMVAAVAILVYRRSRPKFGLAARLAAWLTVLLALIAINPMSTPRFILGTGLLSLWFAATRATLLRQRLLTVALPLALVFVLPYADFFRTNEETLNWAPVRAQLSTNGDYDAFQELARGFDMVQDQGLTLGRHLLGAILFFVPRSTWPEKPVSTGTDIAHHAGGAFFNVSAPLWVELLVDFGIAGVAVGFFLVGRLLLAGDRKYAEGVSLHSEWWAVAGPLIAFYSIVVYRGSFSSMFPGLLITSLCVWVLRQRRGRTSRVAGGTDTAGSAVKLGHRTLASPWRPR